MPELIALRAAFGQDEANHGIRRYRVGGDGLVHVPAEAAFFLVNKGGFAVAKTTVAQVPGGSLPAPLPDGTPRLQTRLRGCACITTALAVAAIVDPNIKAIRTATCSFPPKPPAIS